MSEFSKGYETRRRPDRTFLIRLFQQLLDLRFYSNQLGYWSASSYGVAILSQPAGDDIGFWGIYQPQKIYYWLAFLFRSAGRYGFGCSFRTKIL